MRSNSSTGYDSGYLEIVRFRRGYVTMCVYAQFPHAPPVISAKYWLNEEVEDTLLTPEQSTYFRWLHAIQTSYVETSAFSGDTLLNGENSIRNV